MPRQTFKAKLFDYQVRKSKPAIHDLSDGSRLIVFQVEKIQISTRNQKSPSYAVPRDLQEVKIWDPAILKEPNKKPIPQSKH